uniref:Uncharacterized protein n=1 Tax=Glossina morsitans morsitans TaxID=37546 RepID=A0A1B0FH33_GLOMM
MKKTSTESSESSVNVSDYISSDKLHWKGS